jgi:hypothetical protein
MHAKCTLAQRRHGLRSGVRFPTHGRTGEAAMLSLVSEQAGRQVEGRVRLVMPLGQLMVGSIREAVRTVVFHLQNTARSPRRTGRPAPGAVRGGEAADDAGGRGLDGS